MNQSELVSQFIEKAELVSARVVRVDSLDQAFEQAIEACRTKAPLDPLMDNGPSGASGPKIMAAPNLDQDAYEGLSKAVSRHPEIHLIRDHLRDYPGGIDMGFTLMDAGIAETGTLVLNSDSEETRLCTMLCEIHGAAVFESDIRPTALSMAGDLTARVTPAHSYTAFITGASRTADIERVLAIGVHGPLELFVFLIRGNGS